MRHFYSDILLRYRIGVQIRTCRTAGSQWKLPLASNPSYYVYSEVHFSKIFELENEGNFSSLPELLELCFIFGLEGVCRICFYRNASCSAKRQYSELLIAVFHFSSFIWCDKVLFPGFSIKYEQTTPTNRQIYRSNHTHIWRCRRGKVGRKNPTSSKRRSSARDLYVLDH